MRARKQTSTRNAHRKNEKEQKIIRTHKICEHLKLYMHKKKDTQTKNMQVRKTSKHKKIHT